LISLSALALQPTPIPASTNWPVNSQNEPYPIVIDPRTEEPISPPPNNLQWVPPEDRIPWGSDERGEFMREWHERGYDEPPGGWSEYDIHHGYVYEFRNPGGGYDMATIYEFMGGLGGQYSSKGEAEIVCGESGVPTEYITRYRPVNKWEEFLDDWQPFNP
jgi:hypothetical protein